MKRFKAYKPRKLRKTRIRGYVLYETVDIVVIATLKSVNRKTGNMIQVWILYRHQTPLDAAKSGCDSFVCFDCPNRDGACYVDLSRAPLGIYLAYHRGLYPRISWQEYEWVFRGRKVRFGAYGEPVAIPLWMLERIAQASDGWTGYTHQWRKPEYAGYRPYLMASCDTAADAREAVAMGWRYFRVRTAEGAMVAGEITCSRVGRNGAPDRVCPLWVV